MKNRICKSCGNATKYEGEQRFEKLGYAYPLFTCVNEKCELYGRTYAGDKYDIEKPRK